MKLKFIFPAVLLFLNSLLSGQDRPFVTLPDQLNDNSYSEWITMPGIQGNEYGVYYFRKAFLIDSLPQQFVIHISGDNRYSLYVNGRMVCRGPAVGDLYNWNYETVDIAGKLQRGMNIISARVWNFGAYRGARQISNTTAFILQGNTRNEQIVNTNHTWKVTKDNGYFPISQTDGAVGGGYIAGATDSVYSPDHPWGWESHAFNDKDWAQARELGKGNHTGLNTWYGTPWLLKKRSIPMMEQVIEKTPRVIRVKGTNISAEKLTGQFDINIPQHTRVEILLDNEQLTMGYPRIHVSKGRGAKIKIQYQEGLFDMNNHKGRRNEWENKTMKGYYDVFVCDGGKDRIFEPLWVRVFRYVKIEITTEDEAIEVHDFHNLFTAYPFEQKAAFSCDNRGLDSIWDVSWRTARLCALENYMDCPYYEQLQYIGDTRIQALISMYVTGDARLVKNAIDQFTGSIQPMGLTKSSHPGSGVQIIPPFSLIYINMLHDYFMLQDDPGFVKERLPAIRFILEWFIHKTDSSGMLGALPYWNHIDGGTREFKAGSPPGIEEGGSAHMTMLLAHTLKSAVELFEFFGYGCDADKYKTIAGELIKATHKQCYDKTKGLIAETGSKRLFSQHTNAIAILAGAFDREEEKKVAEKLIADSSIAQASLYFNFYIFQALKKAGYGGELLNQLEKWKVFLDYGFTTFPEHGINSRSDCHAWSAHPIYDLINITCGISPAAPGFRKVLIEPQLGNLNYVSGSAVHPSGEIKTLYEKDKNDQISCKIELPGGVTGVLIWKERQYELAGGMNSFCLK